MSLLISMTLAAATLQGEPATQPNPAPPSTTAQKSSPDDGGSDTTPASAEDLRVRIREMRMNLLLGGEQVRKAEAEAVEFYEGKSQTLDRRLDDVAAELTEVRATYEVTLDRALSNGGVGGGDALKEAQPLRARISNLESEEDDLQRRKARVNEMVQGVASRDRERQRLADQVESASVRPEDLGMPLSSIGLAPPPIATEASAPFDDDALLGDLLERDPRSARRLLFQTDPTRYWERFPLRPPTRELSQAIRFPLPDPPGQR
ncbi:MAG: hypothetical protein AAGB93_15425 [Planctomycetota bacterium]